jgi:uncharacterized membrane protein YfcA
MGIVWLFLISIAAGFVGAMSGMGGGVVLIPAMTLIALVEHNWKYSAFTGFVFVVLTYSLFLC